MEFGIPVELVTPAGTLTFNDFASAYHYRLSEFALGKPMRKPVDPRPQASGALVFPGRRGGAYPVLEGLLRHDTLARRATMIDDVKALPAALEDADGTLRWTPTGKAQRQMTVQLLEDVIVRGGLFKEFHLALVASDPTTYAAVEQTADTIALTTASGGALVFPVVFPFSFGAYSGGGTVTVTNAGNAKSWPRLRVYGRMDAPIVRNTTTGKTLAFPGLSVGAGDYVEIDCFKRTVLLNGAANLSMMRYLDRATSEFFQLAAGANTLQLQGSNFDGVAKVRVYWRDAWA